MNKNFLIVIATLTACISIIASGCSNNSNNTTPQTEQTDNVSEETQEQKEPTYIVYEEQQTEGYILDVQYEEKKDQIYYPESDAQTAQIFTVGIQLEENKTFDDVAEVKFITDKTYTVQNTNWVNKDKTYGIYVVRLNEEIIGEAHINAMVTMKDGTDKELYLMNKSLTTEMYKFNTDNSTTCDQMININDRFYIVDHDSQSETNWITKDDGTEASTITHSFYLMPINNRFDKTLTTADIVNVTYDDIPNTEAVITINEVSEKENGNLESLMNIIDVKLIRTITEEKNQDGNYPDEVYEQWDQDCYDLLKTIKIEFKDYKNNPIFLTLERNAY